MKTSVKLIHDTRAELTISLDASDLSSARQAATAKLAAKVKVPGFRQGKAPAQVAARHVDPVLLEQQTLDDALSRYVAEAFLGEGIQVLQRPEVSIKVYEPSSLLECTAEADILPKITLGDYKKLKVEQEKVTVPAKEVTEVLERLQKSMAIKTSVSREARDGDEAVIDFIGKKDGVAFEGGTGNDYKLVLGSGSFIPGFEEGVIGRNVGETFDIDLTFPENYHAADLKGQAVTFTVILKSLNEQTLPELSDEFASKAGPFTTLAELKNDIKSELLRQKEQEASEKLKDELVSQLVDVSSVPVPSTLIEDQLKAIEQDLIQNLAYQGTSLEQYLKDKGFESRETWLEQDVQPVARKRVQAGLVLAELSKVEKITASTKDVEDRISHYKKQYAKQAHMLAQLNMPETRRDIANRLLTEKTVDFLASVNTSS